MFLASAPARRRLPSGAGGKGPQKRRMRWVHGPRGRQAAIRPAGNCWGGTSLGLQHFSRKKRCWLACFFLVLAGWAFSPRLQRMGWPQ